MRIFVAFLVFKGCLTHAISNTAQKYITNEGVFLQVQEPRIESNQNHCGVTQHATHNDDAVEVW